MVAYLKEITQIALGHSKNSLALPSKFPSNMFEAGHLHEMSKSMQNRLQGRTKSTFFSLDFKEPFANVSIDCSFPLQHLFHFSPFLPTNSICNTLVQDFLTSTLF